MSTPIFSRNHTELFGIRPIVFCLFDRCWNDGWFNGVSWIWNFSRCLPSVFTKPVSVSNWILPSSDWQGSLNWPSGYLSRWKANWSFWSVALNWLVPSTENAQNEETWVLCSLEVVEPIYSSPAQAVLYLQNRSKVGIVWNIAVNFLGTS